VYITINKGYGTSKHNWFIGELKQHVSAYSEAIIRFTVTIISKNCKPDDGL